MLCKLPGEISDTIQDAPRLVYRMTAVFTLQNLLVLVSLFRVFGHQILENNQVFLIVLILITLPIGISMVLLLSLVKTLNRLITTDLQVDPILRFYFGNACYWVFAWLRTFLFIGLVVATTTISIPG